MSEVASGVLSHKDYARTEIIIKILEEKSAITPKEAVEATGKSPATVRRYMNILAASGIVIPEGNTNNVIYRIKSKE